MTLPQYEGASHKLACLAGASILLAVAATHTALGEMHARASSSSSIAISTGGGDSVALKSDGTVWAWGYGGYGELGNGTTTTSPSPVQVTGLTNMVAVNAGTEHALAVKADGSTWAWGANGDGELGNGSTTDSDTPVQVTGLSQVITVAAGLGFSVALKADGTVWAWGYNADGELGNGSITNSATPVQVLGITGATAIAAGDRHAIALKADGTVWAWGYNADGELGDGTSVNSEAPVPVSGLSGVTAIAGGYFHSLALKSDGTVWAWGANTFGQLGNGTTASTQAPIQVSAMFGATAIAAGVYHSVALKTDGTVWAWGDNHAGELGNGTTVSQDAPVQTSTISGVSDIAAGYYQSLAVKSDGTVWAWGDNVWGQLGTGSTTTTGCACSDTPVQSLMSVGSFQPPPTSVRAAAGASYVEVRWSQPSPSPSGYTVTLHCSNGNEEVVPDQTASVSGSTRAVGFQMLLPAYPSTCQATVAGVSDGESPTPSNAVTVTGNSGANLTYFGGPVQDDPGVYVMAWQPTQSANDAGYDQYVKGFIQAMSGTDYFGISTEYFDGSRLPNLPSSQLTIAGTSTDTTVYPVHSVPTIYDTYTLLCGGACIESGDVETEISNDATALGWTLDVNHTVVVLLEQGEGECKTILGNVIQCSGSGPGEYCGYHDSNGNDVYAVVPYPTPQIAGSGCSPLGTGGPADQENAVYFTAHELLEAKTDPTSGGWCLAQDHNPVVGCMNGEIADQCQSLLQQNDYAAVDGYTLPYLWSNLGPVQGSNAQCYAQRSW